jgi:hypothetical protein
MGVALSQMTKIKNRNLKAENGEENALFASLSVDLFGAVKGVIRPEHVACIE